MRFYILLIFSLASLPAYAQMQKGYSTEQPSVVVDRSVLEDLKGYQPPPMFDEPEIQKSVIVPKTQNLAVPKPESLLSYPVQNFHVLTERNSQVKKHSPAKTTSKKIEDKPVIASKEIIQQPKPEPIKTAYKPKASPTMPAIPPISVEKDILPPLPVLNSETQAVLKPSVSERIMDAALERQIEKDNEKIKESLAIEKAKNDKKVKEAKMPSNKNSLKFDKGQTNMTTELESQILKSILPEITNDINSRIQILSFATSPDKNENSAKRISLARALSVRDSLKKMNVDTSRIDVRALSSDNSSPMDKVDIVLLK